MKTSTLCDIVVKQHNHIIWIFNVEQKMHGTTQQGRKLGELVLVHGGKGETFNTYEPKKKNSRMSARPFLLSIHVKVAPFPPWYNTMFDMTPTCSESERWLVEVV